MEVCWICGLFSFLLVVCSQFMKEQHRFVRHEALDVFIMTFKRTQDWSIRELVNSPNVDSEL